MEKRVAVRYIVVVIIFIGLVGMLFVLQSNLLGFAVFQDDFKFGNYDKNSGTYTSMIFDAGSEARWNSLSWEGKDVLFRVRACSLSDCFDADFVEADLKNLNLIGRYFQYKAYFSDGKLDNVVIGYDVLNSAPFVTILSPQEGGIYTHNESIDLEFIIDDIDGDIDNCWYSVNDREAVLIEGCNSSKFDVPGSGNYVLIVGVRDSKGNEYSVSSSFVVDVPEF